MADGGVVGGGVVGGGVVPGGVGGGTGALWPSTTSSTTSIGREAWPGLGWGLRLG